MEEPLLVPDVGQHDVLGVQQRLAAELELEPVQVGLVVVEQVERRRVEAPDLPAQLAADRATGAGYQHPLAGDDGPAFGCLVGQ